MTLIKEYAQRQATISAHQEQIRLYLGFRPFGPTEQDDLRQFILNEAARVEHLSALKAQAEVFLYQQFPEVGKSQYSSGIPTCLFVNGHAKMGLS